MMEGIELPNKEKIRILKEKETYKYLGRLDVDTIKQIEMEEKYFKGVSQEDEETAENQNI